VTDVRLAALLAALSLGGDLGHGRTLEHSLRATYLACRLAQAIRLAEAERRDVLYVGLLQAVGCVGNAHEISSEGRTDDIAFKREIAPAIFLGPADQLRVVARHFGSTGPAAARPIAVLRALADRGAPSRNQTAHCETGALIARRAGLGQGVSAGLFGVMERWDGRGLPAGARRETIPLVARIVTVGVAADLFRVQGSDTAAVERVRDLSGSALDPSLVSLFLELTRRPSFWSALDAPTLWEDVLALEPAPPLVLGPASLDELALAFADFADVKAPSFVGHSRAVAALAADTAQRVHLSGDAITQLRHAALLHDVGRASVPNSILEKPRQLTPGERERVRLHSYYTERVLERAPAFAACAEIAGAHHERLDGSGYHRGTRAAALPLASRVLAAADVFQAATETRAYRAARTPEQAASLVRQEASGGRLDPDVAEAVIASAGASSPRRLRAPSTLTERELDIVRLLASGHANREIAHRLDISDNTVRHHLENVYAKLEITTRTGAVMQALARGLL
jgi:HD-GYP domain-containing protein (c-di-GMP phosphodiesterase class II)